MEVRSFMSCCGPILKTESSPFELGVHVTFMTKEGYEEALKMDNQYMKQLFCPDIRKIPIQDSISPKIEGTAQEDIDEISDEEFINGQSVIQNQDKELCKISKATK